MTPQTRATVLRALRRELDRLLTDLNARRHGYYAKTEWRGDVHRRRIATDIADVRAAIRELKVRDWPAWYASEPLMAYHVEGR